MRSKPLGSRYEMVVLDCPPSLSLVGVNALVAADAVVIPVPPQPLALEGLGQPHRRRSRRCGGGSARDARMLGVLITMAGPEQESDAAPRASSSGVPRADLPHRNRHQPRAAGGARRGRDHLRSTRRARAPADAFRRLAGEVLERLRTPRPDRRPPCIPALRRRIRDGTTGDATCIESAELGVNYRRIFEYGLAHPSRGRRRLRTSVICRDDGPGHRRPLHGTPA